MNDVSSLPVTARRPAWTGARRHLARADPELARLIREVGPCMLRIEADREPFESLVRAVAHQQLHGRAAAAILARMIALSPDGAFPAPSLLLAHTDEVLRGCGFSGAKAAALRAVCRGALDGVVPTRAQAMRLSDAALIERLVSLRGIGRWTVEMLLIFSLGRKDVMPVDDFGVREGYRLIKRLPEQPKPRALAALTEGWSPYRSIGAWYLWRAADAAKGRPGALPLDPAKGSPLETIT